MSCGNGKKRDIGSYIPVTISDSEEEDSDSDAEGELTINPDEESIKVNLFNNNAFDPTPKPVVKSRPKRRFTNVMPGQEPLHVFLRVRPMLSEEIESGEDQGCIKIADGHDILLTAPKNSHNYKNFLHGTAKASHKYTFSKIMDPDVKQKQFFEESTLQTVQDFVNGQNCLVFTYGVTNSGKTYTIQGEGSDPGILPRSLDVLFNSVEAQLDESARFQPNMFSSVVRLSDEDMARGAKDKHDVLLMSIDTETQSNNAANTTANSTINSTISGETSVIADSRLSQTDSDRGSVSSAADSSTVTRPSLGTDELEMLPEINRQIEDMAVDIQGQGNVKFSIWVSFAEIYNEFIYDLLEKIPTLAKGKKFKRRVLRLSDDPNGNVFIKGLKKICVKNSDEAYRVMLAGQKNLHKAATKLNHNSSRSHCIYTISLVRIVDPPSPKVARTSMLHLVDLAGSERQKKTQSDGDRLKESSNINTTLLTLGRCIQALKYNQTHPPNKHQIVPFRESRLTRLFQTFFQGKGRAMMIVNVNQLASTFDETLHAVKFSAIAKEVVIVTQPDPPPKEIKEKKIMGPPPVPANSRTSNAVKPRAPVVTKVVKSTTADIKTTKDNNPKAPAAKTSSSSSDEPFNMNVTTSSESSDGSCRCKDVPTEYYTLEQGTHMKTMIETLKENMRKRGRENREMEMRIRQEVTEEMAQNLVKIQDECDERVTDAQNAAEEMMEKRIELLQDGIRAQNDRQARKRRRDEEDDNGKMSTSMKKRLEEQQHRVETLQTENSKLQFNLSSAKAESKQLKIKVDDFAQKDKEVALEMEQLKAQLKEKSGSEAEMISNRELITSLQQQLSTQRSKNKELENEKDELQACVEEAASAFMEKEKEIDDLKKRVGKLEEDKSSLVNEKAALLRDVDDLRTNVRCEGELKSRLENDRSEMERLRTDSKEATDRVNAAEKTATDLRAELAENARKLENVTTTLEAKNETINSLGRRMETLQSEKSQLSADAEKRVNVITSALSDKDAELKIKSDAIERLDGEIGTSKTLVGELEENLGEETRKNRQLTKDLEVAQRTNGDLAVHRRDDLAAAEEAAAAAVDESKKKIAAIEIENENMKTERNEVAEEKKKLEEELEKLLSEEERRTESLKRELEKRDEELARKESEREKATQSLEESKERLKEVEARLNRKNMELIEANGKIIRSDEKLEALGAELKNAKISRLDEDGAAEERLRQLRDQLDDVREKLNSKEIEGAKLKVEMESAEKRVSDSKAAHSMAEITWNEKKERLERKLDSLELEVKSGNDSLNRNDAVTSDLRRQIENLEREYLTEKKEKDILVKNMDELQSNSAEKEDQLSSNYKKILQEQELAMDEQDKVMKKKEEDCERLKEEVKKLKIQNQDIEKNEGLKKIMDDLKREIEAKTTTIEQLEQALSRSRKALEEINVQGDAKKLESVRLIEKVGELEREVEGKSRELEAVNREKSESEAVISVLENQVMEIRNQLGTMTSADDNGPEIRRLESEVESLKAYKLACDKRMSDKDDELVASRQELKVAETKKAEELARLNEEKMRSEDKLNQFKKDRDEIVDQLGTLIKKRDNKIKELEEKLNDGKEDKQRGLSQSKMTSIKKKVKVKEEIEEDFLTASSDSDTNESAHVKKRKSVEITETTNPAETPDAKSRAFAHPSTEPKRRKTATSSVKSGVRSSSRRTRAATDPMDGDDEMTNDATSPPIKPPRMIAQDESEEDTKENEKSSKKAPRSTRKSARKPVSARQSPLMENNENESDPSDGVEDGASEKSGKTKSRRKLYTAPAEPVDNESLDKGKENDLNEEWGISPFMKKMDRKERQLRPARGRAATRNK